MPTQPSLPSRLVPRARSAPRRDYRFFLGPQSPPALASRACLPPDSRPGRQKRQRHRGCPCPSSHLCRDRWGYGHPQGDAASPTLVRRMADTHTRTRTRRVSQAGPLLLSLVLLLSLKEADFRWQQNRRAPVSLKLPPQWSAESHLQPQQRKGTIPSLPGTQERDRVPGSTGA